MKRLFFGLGIGAALAFAWRRLLGAQQDTQPSGKGTDNDPEDSMRAGAPDDATIVDRVQSPTMLNGMPRGFSMTSTRCVRVVFSEKRRLMNLG